MKLPEEVNREEVVSKQDYEKLFGQINDDTCKDQVRLVDRSTASGGVHRAGLTGGSEGTADHDPCE